MKKRIIITDDRGINENDKPVDLLTNARDFAFVTAVYLYFIGWVYVTYYLKGFGISIRQVDLDIYNLITYSVDVFLFVFFDHFWITLSIILVCSISVWLLFRINKFKAFYDNHLGKHQVKLFLLLLFLLFFFVSVWAARCNSDDAKFAMSSELHTIKFVLKKEAGDNLEQIKHMDSTAQVKAKQPIDLSLLTTMQIFKKWNEQEQLRLLIFNKDIYYAYRLDPQLGQDAAKSLIPQIFMIKKDDISLVMFK